MHGTGTCREFNYCNGNGICIDGRCQCKLGFVDPACSLTVVCKFWDDERRLWSTSGVTSIITNDTQRVTCSTEHLTTFGGILVLPSSAEELLNELQDALRFQTFTLDEMGRLLSQFTFADNETIVTVVLLLLSFNIVSVLVLGICRGRRHRISRARVGKPFRDEEVIAELSALKKEQHNAIREHLLAMQIEHAPLKGSHRPKLVKLLPLVRLASHRSRNRSSGGCSKRGENGPAEQDAAACSSSTSSSDLQSQHMKGPASFASVGRSSLKYVITTPPSVQASQAGDDTWRLPTIQNPVAGFHAAQSTDHAALVQQDDYSMSLAERAMSLRRLKQQERDRELQAKLLSKFRSVQQGPSQHENMATTEVSRRWALIRAHVADAGYAPREMTARLMRTARAELTLVNLLAPPQDEESLTPAQIVQLFWTALGTELFVICFTYSSDSAEESIDLATGADSSFTFSPVTVLAQGMIASGICMSVLTLCTVVFRWANVRRRGHNWLGSVRKLCKRVSRGRFISGLGTWPRDFYTGWLVTALRKLPKLAVDRLQSSANKDHRAPAPEGMRWEKRRVMSLLGWIWIVFMPPIGLLALCLCRRTEFVLVEDQPDVTRRRVATAKVGPITYDSETSRVVAQFSNLSRADCMAMRDRFDEADLSGRGHLTYREMILLLAKEGISEGDMKDIVREVDCDGGGVVTFVDFLQVMGFERRAASLSCAVRASATLQEDAYLPSDRQAKPFRSGRVRSRQRSTADDAHTVGSSLLLVPEGPWQPMHGHPWWWADRRTVPKTKRGPLTSDEMMGLHSRGIISEETLVWQHPMEGWEPFHRVLGEAKREWYQRVDDTVERLKREKEEEEEERQQGELPSFSVDTSGTSATVPACEQRDGRRLSHQCGMRMPEQQPHAVNGQRQSRLRPLSHECARAVTPIESCTHITSCVGLTETQSECERALTASAMSKREGKKPMTAPDLERLAQIAERSSDDEEPVFLKLSSSSAAAQSPASTWSASSVPVAVTASIADSVAAPLAATVTAADQITKLGTAIFATAEPTLAEPATANPTTNASSTANLATHDCVVPPDAEAHFHCNHAAQDENAADADGGAIPDVCRSIAYDPIMSCTPCPSSSLSSVSANRSDGTVTIQSGVAVVDRIGSQDQMVSQGRIDRIGSQDRIVSQGQIDRMGSQDRMVSQGRIDRMGSQDRMGSCSTEEQTCARSQKAIRAGGGHRLCARAAMTSARVAPDAPSLSGPNDPLPDAPPSPPGEDSAQGACGTSNATRSGRLDTSRQESTGQRLGKAETRRAKDEERVMAAGGSHAGGRVGPIRSPRKRVVEGKALAMAKVKPWGKATVQALGSQQHLKPSAAEVASVAVAAAALTERAAELQVELADGEAAVIVQRVQRGRMARESARQAAAERIQESAARVVQAAARARYERTLWLRGSPRALDAARIIQACALKQQTSQRQQALMSAREHTTPVEPFAAADVEAGVSGATRAPCRALPGGEDGGLCGGPAPLSGASLRQMIRASQRRVARRHTKEIAEVSDSEDDEVQEGDQVRLAGDMHPSVRPEGRRARSLSNDSKAAAIEERIQRRVSELRWRSHQSYVCRQTVAWAIALMLNLISLFTSLIYALKFGEATMNACMVAWAIAYGWTFAVAQPIQVMILVLTPGLFSEETRCGKAMMRLRKCYNELLAD